MLFACVHCRKGQILLSCWTFCYSLPLMQVQLRLFQCHLQHIWIHLWLHSELGKPLPKWKPWRLAKQSALGGTLNGIACVAVLRVSEAVLHVPTCKLASAIFVVWCKWKWTRKTSITKFVRTRATNRWLFIPGRRGQHGHIWSKSPTTAWEVRTSKLMYYFTKSKSTR